MIKHRLYRAFRTIILLLAGSAYTYASSLFVEPSSGTVYLQDCYQPFSIKMNLEGTETLAVDARLFMHQAFAPHTDSGYVRYETGDMQHLSSFPFITGVAFTPPARTYTYINAYQDGTSPLTGDDLTIVTMYLAAETSDTTGAIEFYHVPGVATEDSNISSGLDMASNGIYTQLTDSLSSVGDGNYTFVDSFACPYRPYLQTGNYFQWTYQANSGVVQQILTSVDIGPAYTNIAPTNRTIRTNTGIDVDMHMNYPARVLTGNMSYLPLLTEQSPRGDWLADRQFRIHENLSGAAFVFETVMGNSGYTYQTGGTNYDHQLYLDVFRYDITPPVATGIVNTRTATLSGYATGYAGWTTTDDEFVVVAFSGVDTAPTTYLSNEINNFAITHDIEFTGAWEGYAIIMDRAGNTGDVYIEIVEQGYLVKAWPQTRPLQSNGDFNYGTIGRVSFYTTGIFDPGTNSYQGLGLVDSGIVTTDHSGTGLVQINAELSGAYFVTFQGISSLQQILLDATITGQQSLIDFSSGAVRLPVGYVEGDGVTYTIGYQHLGITTDPTTTFQVLSSGYNFDEGFVADPSLMITNVTPGSVPIPTMYVRDNLAIAPNSTGELTLKLELNDPLPPLFNVDGYRVFMKDSTNNDATYMALTNKSYQVHTQLIAGDLMFPAMSWTGYDGCVRLADGGRIPPNIGTSWTDYHETDLNNDGITNTADLAFFLSNLDRGQTCAGAVRPMY